MTTISSRLALAASLLSLVALSACGGDPASTEKTATSDAATSSSAASDTTAASAGDAASAPGTWQAATAGQVLDVTLGDLHPTQAALGYDQIYYKLGRYEADMTKEFDDFCADEGLTGLASSSTTSTLTDATSYTCTVTDTTQRDTSVLNPVVIGPNGDTLYLTDGHHGSSTYYEVANGGPTVHVHVVVKDNLSAYSGSTFWAEMQNRGYTRLKDANGVAITADQLPTALGLTHGMQNDVYRSLVYFTRDVGYSKPTPSTDFLEFYWADWLRTTFPLTGYTLTKAGTTDPDPATADTGYLNAVWNASTMMVASTDGEISGLTGAQLGRLAQINSGKAYTKGTFGDLSKAITASKPGKIAYALDYKTRHGIQ
ncbi:MULTISPECIES: ParB/Srx family N-terminal domain-containing protein [unclassified Paraburkholderia]|uniref:ParB/Srx family N-terminal domain-containing protein n=1 Tax=unclassified Paraburkholderia TaxID=2615204 RepID=UPI001981217B|nr:MULTISPECIES: ParB/Srx family N-terminal domain-containing protein [unclassified Paraburkholderia]MBN3856963.1 chromosome partitioning protein ParB [Paraburkholderia sp. Ac-20340]